MAAFGNSASRGPVFALASGCKNDQSISRQLRKHVLRQELWNAIEVTALPRDSDGSFHSLLKTTDHAPRRHGCLGDSTNTRKIRGKNGDNDAARRSFDDLAQGLGNVGF